MGSRRIAPSRSSRFWFAFVGIILGASLLAFGIALWATQAAPVLPTGESQNQSQQNAINKHVPAGPKIHDTLGKQKQFERN